MVCGGRQRYLWEYQQRVCMERGVEREHVGCDGTGIQYAGIQFRRYSVDGCIQLAVHRCRMVGGVEW